MNFYQSPSWEKKRIKILKRDKYMCQECRRYGKTSTASTVHHIKPLEEYPELALDDKNLISLCNRCHEGMHDRISRVLTARGIELLRRTYPPSLEG